MKIKMNGVSLEVKHLTIIYGEGKWEDNDGEIYDIHSITLPTMPSGKHITVHSKDIEEVVENRSYDDGKVLSFESKSIDHWDI